MNILYLIIIGIILIVLFILLKLTKVPEKLYRNKVIYSDHKERLEKPLFSLKYNLTGKPDFILHTKDGLLPLDIKNTRRPNQPYFNHVMQLISYCLLMEEERGIRPKYGILHYQGGQFSIQYTNKLKFQLIGILQKMRHHLNSGIHPIPIRKPKCDNCAYKNDCFGIN